MDTTQKQDCYLENRFITNGVYSVLNNIMFKKKFAVQFSCKEIDLSIVYENIRV